MTTGKEVTPARLLAESLRGILLPFITPFNDDGEADARALSANIEKWNETGIRGYVALGSTGERVHLSERECLALIETARERVPSDMAFIVGAGQQSTRASILEVREWASAGADAVLLITPNFYRAEMTQSALSSFFREVADASPVPVMLYNVPQLTGMVLQPETVAALCEHPNIFGIKDSSGDIVNLGETLRLVNDEAVVMVGHGSALAAALGAGASGGILAIGCVAPRLCVDIFGALHAGEHERARSLQRRLALLVRVVMGRYGIGGIKTAMDALGYSGGRVRSPLRQPDEAARLEIMQALKASGLSGEEIESASETRTFGAGIK